MLQELKDELSEVAEMVNQIEDIRRQIIDMQEMMPEKEKKLIKSEISTIQDTLKTFERKLIQLKYTGTGQDAVRYPVMLAEQIYYLATAVAISDFAPPDQHKEVHRILKDKLSSYKIEYEELKESEIAGFLEKLRSHRIGPVIIGERP